MLFNLPQRFLRRTNNGLGWCRIHCSLWWTSREWSIMNSWEQTRSMVQSFCYQDKSAQLLDQRSSTAHKNYKWKEKLVYIHSISLYWVQETSLFQIEPEHLWTDDENQTSKHLFNSVHIKHFYSSIHSLFYYILTWSPQNTGHRKGSGKKSLVRILEYVSCSSVRAGSGTLRAGHSAETLTEQPKRKINLLFKNIHQKVNGQMRLV